MWIKVISISPPHNDKKYYHNSYPIAIGPKKNDHEKVEMRFAKELESFKSSPLPLFYHGGLKRMVRVYVDILLTMQDQPERRSANHLLGGNSNYTARWGYSFHLKSTYSKIPACTDCIRKLFKKEKTSGCNLCAAWDFDTNNNGSILDFEYPANYPDSEKSVDRKLSPFRITYESLKNAVTKTHQSILEKEWSKDEATSYLKMQGITVKSVNRIIQNAMNVRNHTNACKEKELNREAYALYEDLKRTSPHEFEQWQFPTMWTRGTTITMVLDAIMHLVFLGAMKICVELNQDWLGLRTKGPKFAEFVSGRLESIQSLNLDWCKALSFNGGKLSGWVSENYVAMARLARWFYSPLGDVASDTIFEEPDSPIEKWLVSELRLWLQVRGLENSGKKNELIASIRTYMDQEGGPPEIVEQKGGSVLEIQVMIQALTCMISHIMKRTVEPGDSEEVDRKIKIFLSCYNNIDRRFSVGLPGWGTKFNLLCLLNLPDAMNEYGPLRNYWEGSMQGEGFLVNVKPQLKTGIRKNWHTNVMNRVIRKRALNLLLEKSDEDEEPSSNEQSFFKYKGLGKALIAWDEFKPISAVQFNNDTYGIVLNTDEIVVIQVRELYKELNGMYYFEWFLERTDVREFNKREIKRNLLLLPFLVDCLLGDDSIRYYTVIDSNWNQIKEDKTYGMEDVPVCWLDE